MKLNLALFTLICLAFLLAGCKKSSPMTGTWAFQAKEQYRAQIGDKMTAKIDFKDDGTFSGKVQAMNQNVDMEGTYKLDGKALTLVTTKAGDTKGSQTEVATLSEDGKSFDMPQFQGYGTMVKQ